MRRCRLRRVAGPGDAHSAQEWIWQRDRYEALFDGAPAGTLRGESTPFYLYDPRGARTHPCAGTRREADRGRARPGRPGVLQLDAPVVRRARAGRRLRGRVRRRGPIAITAGWAPFWHYRRLGLYGEQLEHLLTVVPPRAGARAALPRPGRPARRVARPRSARSSASSSTDAIDVRGENTRPFVRPGLKTRVIAPLVRAGASVGRHFPPEVWRRASVPLLMALHAHGTARPPLPTHARRVLVDYYADDIRRLSAITGDDYTDWLGEQGRGEYSTRIAVPVA